VQAENTTYCGAEVLLSDTARAINSSTPVPVGKYASKLSSSDGWYRVSIPLSTWACDQGSVGGLAGVDRVDFQNVNLRDADVCLDNIAIVQSRGGSRRK
jgi:hypothetical protein